MLGLVLGLDPDGLYVTYFGGYGPGELGPSDEAKELWRGVGVPCWFYEHAAKSTYK